MKRAEPSAVETYDFRGNYVDDLENIIDIDAIRKAGIRIGADPLGGASVNYWKVIAEKYDLDLTVVNPQVDPAWAFMTLDWDGKIRMDPSSTSAMASVVARRDDFDILTGNDADADRHGIVTPDGGLMNPNHYLAVAIQYLYTHRDGWRQDAAIGKTLVSSTMIDRVAASLGRELWEVPVGLQVVRARPHRRIGRLRRRGERRRELPAQGRHGVDHGQGRHPAGPARERDPRGDRQDTVAAVRGAGGGVRRPRL